MALKWTAFVHCCALHSYTSGSSQCTPWAGCCKLGNLVLSHAEKLKYTLKSYPIVWIRFTIRSKLGLGLGLGSGLGLGQNLW